MQPSQAFAVNASTEPRYRRSGTAQECLRGHLILLRIGMYQSSIQRSEDLIWFSQIDLATRTADGYAMH